MRIYQFIFYRHTLGFSFQVNGITLHDSDHYEAVDVLKSSGNDITMVVGREFIITRKTEDDEEEEEEEGEESAGEVKVIVQQELFPLLVRIG